MTGESILEDWTIKTSSLKDSTAYDSRMVALPGKAAPKGWVATMPNSNLNTLSEEWIQVLLHYIRNTICNPKVCINICRVSCQSCWLNVNWMLFDIVWHHFCRYIWKETCFYWVSPLKDMLSRITGWNLIRFRLNLLMASDTLSTTNSHTVL